MTFPNTFFGGFMPEQKQKIGAGHVKAMMRQGAKEIAQSLPAFPSHGIQPVEEPGLAGNLTPQEVARDKGAYESLLQRYSSQAPERQEQTKDLDR
jgi:hypothetical protein